MHTLTTLTLHPDTWTDKETVRTWLSATAATGLLCGELVPGTSLALAYQCHVDGMGDLYDRALAAVQATLAAGGTV